LHDGCIVRRTASLPLLPDFQFVARAFSLNTSLPRLILIVRLKRFIRLNHQVLPVSQVSPLLATAPATFAPIRATPTSPPVLVRRGRYNRAWNTCKIRRCHESSLSFAILTTVASSDVTVVTPGPRSTRSPCARMRSCGSPSHAIEIKPERHARRVLSESLIRREFCEPRVLRVITGLPLWLSCVLVEYSCPRGNCDLSRSRDRYIAVRAWWYCSSE
jgi:hypothetical protein